MTDVNVDVMDGWEVGGTDIGLDGVGEWMDMRRTEGKGVNR